MVNSRVDLQNVDSATILKFAEAVCLAYSSAAGKAHQTCSNFVLAISCRNSFPDTATKFLREVSKILKASELATETEDASEPAATANTNNDSLNQQIGEVAAEQYRKNISETRSIGGNGTGPGGDGLGASSRQVWSARTGVGILLNSRTTGSGTETCLPRCVDKVFEKLNKHRAPENAINIDDIAQSVAADNHLFDRGLLAKPPTQGSQGLLQVGIQLDDERLNVKIFYDLGVYLRSMQLVRLIFSKW